MMNIGRVEAGPELDVLVAEKVMGWTLVHPDDASDYPGLWIGSNGMLTGRCSEEWSEKSFDEHSPYSSGCAPALFTPAGVFQPSTDISAAFPVLLRLRELGFSYRIYSIGGQVGAGCNVWGGPKDNYWFAYPESGLFVEAPTAELAICRAALTVMAQSATHTPEWPTEDEVEGRGDDD